MPEFSNPFSGIVPGRKLTHEELVRVIRLDIAAEQEAIHLYMAHAEATDHPLAREVLIDVANEEREHVGEFMQLLEILTGDEAQWLAHGREEVQAIEGRMNGVQEAVSERVETKLSRDGRVTSSGEPEDREVSLSPEG